MNVRDLPENARNWLSMELEPPKSIKIVYDGHFSKIWEVEIGHRIFLLKAPKHESIEGQLLRTIENFAPQLVPSICIAWSDCFLMKKIRHVKSSPTADVLAQFFSNYALLQIKSIEYSESLKNAGIVELGLHLFETEFSRWLDLNHEEFVGSKCRSESLKAELSELIEAICIYKIPYALEHGDLHQGNLLNRSLDGLALIDWSEATITHPFLSIPYFFNGEGRKSSSGSRKQVQAYLNMWTKFGSQSRLEDLLVLIDRLSKVYFGWRYALAAKSLPENNRSSYTIFTKNSLTRFLA